MYIRNQNPQEKILAILPTSVYSDVGTWAKFEISMKVAKGRKKEIKKERKIVFAFSTPSFKKSA